MPWVRFDDQFPIHRKVAGLNDAAFRLHTEAIFWCARNLTDGFIGEDELHQIDAKVRSKLKLTREYLSRGLWHLPNTNCASDKCPAPVGHDRPGWVIHDYWQYQPSAEQVHREREAKAARQHRWLEGKKRRSKDASQDGSEDTSRDASEDAAPYPTRPSSGSGWFQRDPPARPRASPNPYSTQNPNPGEGAAARHPSARTPTEAAAAAGITPNGTPARGDTVHTIADEIRRTITEAKDPP